MFCVVTCKDFSSMYSSAHACNEKQCNVYSFSGKHNDVMKGEGCVCERENVCLYEVYALQV